MSKPAVNDIVYLTTEIAGLSIGTPCMVVDTGPDALPYPIVVEPCDTLFQEARAIPLNLPLAPGEYSRTEVTP